MILPDLSLVGRSVPKLRPSNEDKEETSAVWFFTVAEKQRKYMFTSADRAIPKRSVRPYAEKLGCSRYSKC
jgi:hypothetical protein